jgi:hypothetical protein
VGHCVSCGLWTVRVVRRIDRNIALETFHASVHWVLTENPFYPKREPRLQIVTDRLIDYEEFCRLDVLTAISPWKPSEGEFA